jgi:hypothetical protein
MQESVFLSYSHADVQWKTSVLKHLSPWHVEVWDDSRIEIGSPWVKEIDAALDRCSAAILLLSPNYLSSEFIMQNELPRILDFVKERELRLICIHVGANSFEATELAKFQSANNPTRPLNMLPIGELDAELKRISVAIACIMSKSANGTSKSSSCVINSNISQTPGTSPKMDISAQTIEAKRISLINLDGANPTNTSSETHISTNKIKADSFKLINQRSKAD